MGLFDFFSHRDAQAANEELYNYEGPVQEEHKAKFSHEFIAGAAGFEAMKAYENHLRERGEKVSHPLMKELLAGFAAAEVDKLVESKGLDWIDAEEAKRKAIAQAHALAEERYGEGNTGWEYVSGQ